MYVCSVWHLDPFYFDSNWIDTSINFKLQPASLTTLSEQDSLCAYVNVNPLGRSRLFLKYVLFKLNYYSLAEGSRASECFLLG